MKSIINFYKSLDVLNTVIFWGVIIVLILITIFTILLIKKTKKLKTQIANEPDEELDDNIEDNLIKEELPDEVIIKEETITEKPITIYNEEPASTEKEELKSEPEEENNILIPIQEENDFKAEEHVIEYDNDLFKLPSLKKATEIEEPKKEKEPFVMPTKPYERNVLREMSLSQTSPIGIVRKEDNMKTKHNEEQEKIIKEELTRHNEEIKNNMKETVFEKEENNSEKIITNEPIPPVIEEMPPKDIEKPTINTEEYIEEEDLPENIEPEEELPNDFEYELPEIEEELEIPKFEEHSVIEEEKIDESLIEPSKQEISDILSKEEIINPLEDQEDIKEENDNNEYLLEVSKKLSEAEEPDEIERTEYELKQEEDAIISYKELMEKKDSIETIDEEDAVISIEELIKRKQEEEKLYNLTEQEKDEDFLSELKKFRSDL